MAIREQPETVQIDGRRLRLTNLSKVLYPATGTTKADVVAYLAEIAPVMLPYCSGRATTRKRWPNGVGTAQEPGEVFFIKNLESSAPDWVVRADIQHSGGPKTYPLVDDRATLAWLGQVAALEIHVPQWRFGSDGSPRHPDRLVLDLDPGEGAGLAECAEVARLARSLLRGMGLEPVPVTSGSKGIHLYSALDGSHSSDEVNAVAHELARAMEADHPDLIVSDMKKSLRGGKVLVDWSQNNGAKTTIAPYSLRGRPHPTVAAPRTWAELDAPDLAHLEYPEVLRLVGERGDPMAVLLGEPDEPYHDPGERTPGSAERARAEREVVAAGGVSAPGGRSDRAAGDRLARYRSMRDPSRTPEPVPASVGDSGGELSFVIQEHHASRWHLDFRLAHDGVLVSWALPKGVPLEGRKNHLAVQTEDHPMEYGSFEGTIPQGEYGGGDVRIWDEGTYELHKWHEGKEVIAVLTGRPGGGLETDGPGRTAKLALIHTGGRGGEGERNHWLIHLMDAGASGGAGRGGGAKGGAGRARVRAGDGAEPQGGDGAKPDSGDDGQADDGEGARDAGGSSAAPGTTARPAFRGRPPRPMLASAGEVGDLVDDIDWALEMKWDGVRAVVEVEGGQIRLTSRNGNDVTKLYPDLADVGVCLDGVASAVLDGEIVALDGRGRPSFARLQKRFNLARPRDIAAAAKSAPVHVMLFDVLAVGGKDVVDETYDERRRRLREVVDPDRHPRLAVPDAFEGDIEAAMRASNEWGLEGVVAKRRDSRYVVGRRSRAWLKVKHTLTQEAVVVGWRPGQGTRGGAVGSLLLAVPGDDGELHYAGRVGSGFTQREARDWVDELAKIERHTPPVAGVPRLDARDARWVSAERVAEVELSEWTTDRRMRHPRWRGWRPDKAPGDVVVEAPG
ncbi:ATP-dependent DNA ligase [Georgenia subflava]|uniref:DNA ligase (ATP) n=1 Tax=Georgenia subflava TaxID=1622177 RepID=A0A6N7EG66_9MICO|nr:ATP-dependent DNA ligase [Georgenia subflava]MPV36173.1 ATP-dependent DNA ligase [Georgenia subflava]